jgi:8-oxo-dGTP pyrophosphatase MutT (NUDIX family)
MPKRTHQVAALPWRRGEGGLEFLLVTTRTTKRWLIPKGWTMDGKADHDAAAIEAYEEAGVKGLVSSMPAGQYGYVKMLRDGKTRYLNVRVYALQIEEVLEAWPEQAERERRWVSKREALEMIGEPELLPVIVAFDGKDIRVETVSPVHVGHFEDFKKWWRNMTARLF